MKRSKIRKLVAALPKNMPPHVIEQALEKVANGKARAQIRARLGQRDAAR